MINPSNNRERIPETSGLYASLAEMLADDIPEVEEIIFGTGPGDVAQLVSVTDAGKTTLTLNTCLRLAAGLMCVPLAPAVPIPRRVLYIDCEATRGKLREYLLNMRRNFSPEEWELVIQNFIPFADPAIADEPLCLSNHKHRELIKERAKRLEVHLIVIDTVSAAFELSDENSNAEVKRAVMKPLKDLARETNAALLFCHHAGKPNESPLAERAYTGRGASTFGALSRAVFTLTKNRLKGADFVTLQCAKAKRRKFEPMLLKLNRERAWFEVCDEKPQMEQELTAQEIADFIDGKSEVIRQEVVQHFKNRASNRTIDRRVIEAEKAGLIEKTKRGRYRSKNVAGGVN